MAKPKNNEQNDDVTYMGKSIDPELQKKVDEYMDVSDTETQSPESSPVEQSESALVEAVEPTAANEATSAPLLPTEQLPDIAKDKPAKPAKTVQVKDAPAEPVEAAEEAAEQEIPQEPAPEVPTTEEEPVEDATETPEPVAAAEVSPVDADGLAAPDFEEKVDYENHTV